MFLQSGMGVSLDPPSQSRRIWSISEYFSFCACPFLGFPRTLSNFFLPKKWFLLIFKGDLHCGTFGKGSRVEVLLNLSRRDFSGETVTGSESARECERWRDTKAYLAIEGFPIGDRWETWETMQEIVRWLLPRSAPIPDHQSTNFDIIDEGDIHRISPIPSNAKDSSC